MYKRFYWLSLFLLACSFSQAQFTYKLDQTIKGEIDGKGLALMWAGGLNAAQINTMDLNGDGREDVVVFDRTANKVITYLAQGNVLQYAPDYESLFPTEISQWMLLRDFNCDGKKDIFTSDPFGIIVFVNTTKPGKQLSWRAYNPGFPLLTAGFSSNINLKVNESDIPAIDDVDGDGDLDILNVRFVGIGTVEWHKNLSIERTGRCDSMQLQRITQTWGEFEDCACGKISFSGGKTCDQLLTGGRSQHTGGKALLSIDLNNDGIRELFFSEESCTNLYLLSNTGSVSNPLMSGFSIFPAGNPIAMPFFPTPYYEDVDFDGLRDLVVSPNLSSRNSLSSDFSKSLLLYKNTGTAQVPQFTLTKNNFLQEQMIDVGDFSVPAFFDFDGDGDQDLFVSTYIKGTSATIFQFENINTAAVNYFKRISDDFFGLSVLNSYNLKIQFADMNADGKMDLAFSSTSKVNGRTTLRYIVNSANDRFLVEDATSKLTNLSLSLGENWIVVDVDQDGQTDILVGNDTGGVEFWKNQGTPDTNTYTMISSNFLGFGSSTDRQNLSFAIADLDADGKADLVTGDQRGVLSIYRDFRTITSDAQRVTKILFNELTNEYESRNLGGRIWPTTANLFNSTKPAIIVGNLLGGLMILRNDEGTELPREPAVSIFPNPYNFSNTSPLKVKSDRDVFVRFYNTLGQPLSENYFVPANQDYPINMTLLPAGVYIAQFLWNGKTYSRRFVVY
jgi:hypothetical protein